MMTFDPVLVHYDLSNKLEAVLLQETPPVLAGFDTTIPPLQSQPPAQRPGESEFVHEFEVAAEGHAAS